MNVLQRMADRTRDWFEGKPRTPVWYHPAYRLPLYELHEISGLEPRRADLALWSLNALRVSYRLDLQLPVRVSYDHMGLVHSNDYLESITQPEALANIFGMVQPNFPVDPVLNTIRLAAGGTIAAARYAVNNGGPTMNLLGGFHHAFRDKGAGLCPINDIAIAIAVLRTQGFTGQVVILDLDAHPPDGLDDTLQDDERVWIGSISGSDWGPLPHSTENVLPPDTPDKPYLRTLKKLLRQAPPPALTFVIAGGDVLANDRFGQLGLTLGGTKKRDQLVHDWLAGRPSVWLPGGGYLAHSWRVLANSALVLSGRSDLRLPKTLDPMRSHFAYISTKLSPSDLGAEETQDELFTADEADAILSGRPPASRKLLNYYTEEGVEYALYKFGLLAYLRSLGYHRYRIKIDNTGTGDRVRVWGTHKTVEHLLVEEVMGIDMWEGQRFLFVNWLTLRHPMGAFAKDRIRLPGQDVPGLGLAREVAQLNLRISKRLKLAGLMARPAYVHTAYVGSKYMTFLDPQQKGEFQALLRDLGDLSLPTLSQKVEHGEVLRNGETYTWPAPHMVRWVDPKAEDEDLIASSRERVHFAVKA